MCPALDKFRSIKGHYHFTRLRSFFLCSPLPLILFIWDIFKFHPSVNAQTFKLAPALQAIRYNSVHIHSSLLFTLRSSSKIQIASSFHNPNSIHILKSPCISQSASLCTLNQPRITALLVFSSPIPVLLFMWHTKFYISTTLEVKITFTVLTFLE